jgi:hypothetical protein
VVPADQFSLLALRRRSVALWLVALGSFSLVISYVVPVAATLAAGTATISPLQTLSTPTLEFPALQVPTVTHHPQTAPPVAQIQPGHMGAASSAAGTSRQHATPTRAQIVTNQYTTRPAPRQPVK